VMFLIRIFLRLEVAMSRCASLSEYLAVFKLPLEEQELLCLAEYAPICCTRDSSSFAVRRHFPVPCALQSHSSKLWEAKTADLRWFLEQFGGPKHLEHVVHEILNFEPQDSFGWVDLVTSSVQDVYCEASQASPLSATAVATLSYAASHPEFSCCACHLRKESLSLSSLSEDEHSFGDDDTISFLPPLPFAFHASEFTDQIRADPSVDGSLDELAVAFSEEITHETQSSRVSLSAESMFESLIPDALPALSAPATSPVCAPLSPTSCSDCGPASEFPSPMVMGAPIAFGFCPDLSFLEFEFSASYFPSYGAKSFDSFLLGQPLVCPDFSMARPAKRKFEWLVSDVDASAAIDVLNDTSTEPADLAHGDEEHVLCGDSADLGDVLLCNPPTPKRRFLGNISNVCQVDV